MKDVQRKIKNSGIVIFCLLLCSCGGASKPLRKTIETAAFALNAADEALKLSFKVHEPEIAKSTLNQCMKEGLNREDCKALYQRNIEKYKYAESLLYTTIESLRALERSVDLYESASGNKKDIQLQKMFKKLQQVFFHISNVITELKFLGITIPAELENAHYELQEIMKEL